MKKYLFAIIILIFNGCTLISSNESNVYKKSTSIFINIKDQLPNAWSNINDETSDFAVSNSKSHSVFLINSSCRKFEAADLNSLSSSMLIGVEIIKIIDKKIITFKDREAIELVVMGKVDGITRFFHIITTQKNNCIYDFVLISTNEKNLENDNQDFSYFIQKVEIK